MIGACLTSKTPPHLMTDIDSDRAMLQPQSEKPTSSLQSFFVLKNGILSYVQVRELGTKALWYLEKIITSFMCEETFLGQG